MSLEKIKFLCMDHDGGSVFVSPVDKEILQAQKKVGRKGEKILFLFCITVETHWKCCKWLLAALHSCLTVLGYPELLVQFPLQQLYFARLTSPLYTTETFQGCWGGSPRVVSPCSVQRGAAGGPVW